MYVFSRCSRWSWDNFGLLTITITNRFDWFSRRGIKRGLAIRCIITTESPYRYPELALNNRRMSNVGSG